MDQQKARTLTTRDELLKALDCRVFKETIDGLGTIYIRHFHGDDRLELERWHQESKEGGDYVKLLTFLLVTAVCDENGNPILTKEDVETLRRKDSTLVSAIADKIRGHNAATSAAKEEAVKNSDSAQSSDSGSTSPSDLGEQSES